MYSKGHAGLTLVIMSLLMLPFPYGTHALALIVLTATFSALPDVDLKWQRKGIPIQHRGPTHSILFALIAGLLFGAAFLYLNKDLIWGAMGFVSGFMAVLSHMVGDLFTHHEFAPLWPFSKKRYAYHITTAGNKVANEGLATLGGAAFMLYNMYHQGILLNILRVFF